MDPGSIVVAALAAAAVAGPVSGSSASAVTRPAPVAAQRLDGTPQRVFDDDLEGDRRSTARSDAAGTSRRSEELSESRLGQRSDQAGEGSSSAQRRLAAALEDAGLNDSGTNANDSGTNDSGTGGADTEQTGTDDQAGDDELAGRGRQGVDEDLAELLGFRSAGDDVDGLSRRSRDDLAEQLDQQALFDAGPGADALAERRASGGAGRQRELGGGAATGTADDDAVEQIAEDLYAALTGMQSPSPAAQRLEAALEDAGFGGAAAAQTDNDATGLRAQNDVVDRRQGSRSSDADLAERLQQLSQDEESPVAALSRSVRSSAASNDPASGGAALGGAGTDLASVLADAGQRSRDQGDQGDLDRRRSIASALERSSSASSGNGPQG
jgi:hypothetical protein